MKPVFIEFVINDIIEPIGLALFEPNASECSLPSKKRKGYARASENPKKNNKIIIPRTVLTQKRENVKRKRKALQESSEDYDSNNEGNFEQLEDNLASFENHQTRQKNIRNYEWDDDRDGDEDDFDEEIEEDEEDNDLDESNQNENNLEEEGSDLSATGYENKKLTKRQWMSKNNNNNETEKFHMQLPDKKPRKKRTLLMTEEQQIKKMEKEEKRRTNTLKQIEEHKQMTVDKILNESGRMQKIRKEKEEQEALKKTNHNYRKLPADEVVVRYISNIKGEKLFLDKTIPSGNWLLNNHELSFYGGELKTGKHKCLNCGNIAKYHLEKPKILHFCSIGCYAKLKLIN